MLLLTRRKGEQIMIGEDITVVVSKIQGRQVTLGITAPADVAIHREEIHAKILEERKLSDGDK